jgi:dihydroorotate dehydrogenase (fumarate)
MFPHSDLNSDSDQIVCNAAGCLCTTEQDLANLLNSDSSAIMSKSCTLESRTGNEHPKYHDDGSISINSNGLENMGYMFYLNWFKKMRLGPKTKPFVLSVAGLTIEDNITIINAAQDAGVTAVELNLSCPNLHGTPVSQNIPLYDQWLKAILSKVRGRGNGDEIRIGLKLPIYTNPEDITKVGVLLVCYDIAFITCSNSFPRGLVYRQDTGDPVVKNVLGGCGGGPLMKAIVLGQIYQFDQELGDERKCGIVMCGGISTKKDISDGLKAGADHFQVGTALITNGLETFTHLL